MCSVTEQRDHVRIYARRGRGAFDRQVGLALLPRGRETKAQAIFRFLFVSLTFPVLCLHLACTCRHCLLPTGSASGLTKPRPIMSASLQSAGPGVIRIIPKRLSPYYKQNFRCKGSYHMLYACSCLRLPAIHRAPSVRKFTGAYGKLGTRRLRAKIVCSTVYQFAAKKKM